MRKARHDSPPKASRPGANSRRLSGQKKTYHRPTSRSGTCPIAMNRPGQPAPSRRAQRVAKVRQKAGRQAKDWRLPATSNHPLACTGTLSAGARGWPVGAAAGWPAKIMSRASPPTVHTATCRRQTAMPAQEPGPPTSHPRGQALAAEQVQGARAQRISTPGKSPTCPAATRRNRSAGAGRQRPASGRALCNSGAVTFSYDRIVARRSGLTGAEG